MPPDKLISRIKAVLNGDTGHFEIQSLALEYADLVMRVRDRLDQCVTLIHADNDYAALQVAESPPPLLDLAAQLAFAESPEWIALCRGRNVPWPPALDQRNIDIVSGLYGRQISESHPLYRDYRQAIRERDELRAMAILTSIVRINPEDRNARSELARLGEKAREAYLKRLEAFLAAGDIAAAFDLADALDNLHMPALAGASVLQRVHALREAMERENALRETDEALPRLARLHENGDWRAAIPVIGRCRSFERHLGLEFSVDAHAQLDAMEAWAGERQEAHDRYVARQEAIRQSNQSLRTLSATRPDVRADSNGLRQYVQRFQQAVSTASALSTSVAASYAPDAHDVEAGLREIAVDEVSLAAVKKLQHHFSVRIQRRASVFVFCIAGAFALVVFAGFSVHRYHADKRARVEAFGRMGSFAEANRLQDAEEFLAAVKSRWNGSSAAYDDAHRKLQEWVSERRILVNAILDDAALLVSLPADTNDPGALEKGFATVVKHRAELGELPLDMREVASAKLRAAELHLNTVREVLVAALLPPFAGRLDEVERQVAVAAAISSSAGRTAALEALQPEIAQLEADGKRIQFLFTEELAGRWNAVTAGAAKTRLAAQQTAEVELVLAGAGTLDKYFEGIKGAALQNEAFTLIQNNEGVLRNPAEKLFTPVAFRLWQVASARPSDMSQPFLPAQIQPGEAVDAAKLAQNKTFERLYSYTLRKYPESASTPDTPVFSVGSVRVERLPIGDGYEERQTADILKADGTVERKEFRLRRFGRPGVRGEALSGGVPTPESLFFNQFSRFYDPVSGRITEPLLNTLDRMRAAKGVSPLLKAYLQQEILKVAESRPAEWGVLFSPSARADAVTLQHVTQGAVAMHDWMNPERWADRLPALQRHYAQPQSAYYTEALAWLRVFQRLAKPGFVYIGHVTSGHQLRVVVHTRFEGLLAGLAPDGQLVAYPCQEILAPAVAADGDNVLLELRNPKAFAEHTPVLMLSVLPAQAATQARFPADAHAPAEGWDRFVIQERSETPPPLVNSPP